MRKFLLILTVLLLIATSVLLWVTRGSRPDVAEGSAGQSMEPPATEVATAQEAGQASIGGAFTLTDHNGQSITDQNYRGKYMLLFFGFTRCPDICPAAFAVMTGALEKIGEKADQVVPVLITIDPEHDTPEVLKTYLANYDKRFIGLTGTEEQLKQATAAYKAYYSKAEGTEMPDHSGYLYLMDKEGRYIRHFSNEAKIDEVAAGLQEAIQ